MHEATPDPPTEELIWFALPPRRPGPASRVEAGDNPEELRGHPGEGEPPRRPGENEGE
jgi:hypothetical protein